MVVGSDYGSMALTVPKRERAQLGRGRVIELGAPAQGASHNHMPRSGSGRDGPPLATAVLLRRLEGRIDDLTKAMLTQIRRELAEYADVADVGGQAGTIRLVISTFLAAANEHRPLLDEERAKLAATGAEAARHGFSLPTLIAGVELGIRVAWLYISEEARELRPKDLGVSALEELGLTLFNFASELNASLREGYRAQSEQLASRLPTGPVGILTELLLGSPSPLDEILTRAEARGLNPKADYGLLLVFGRNGETEGSRVSDVGARIHQVVPSAISVRAPFGAVPHVAIVAPTPSRRAWETSAGRTAGLIKDLPVQVLAMEPTSGLERLVDSYRWARQALRIARTKARPGVPLWDRDLAAYRLLQDAGEAERTKFIHLVLGPVLTLTKDRRDGLLTTLDLLELQGFRPAAAAAALHLHEKTLRYRLNRVEELTGLDLQLPQDRFKLQLALHLLKLTSYPGG